MMMMMTFPMEIPFGTIASLCDLQASDTIKLPTYSLQNQLLLTIQTINNLNQ